MKKALKKNENSLNDQKNEWFTIPDDNMKVILAAFVEGSIQKIQEFCNRE